MSSDGKHDDPIPDLARILGLSAADIRSTLRHSLASKPEGREALARIGRPPAADDGSSEVRRRKT